MDIHKPKPWHGLREFLKEYAIIVVGVLTALGAEQVVSMMHEATLARDGRDAVRREISDNLAELGLRTSSRACVSRRLDEIEALLDAADRGARIPLATWIGRPNTPPITTTRWEAAMASGRTSLFSNEEQAVYANFYSRFDTLKQLYTTEQETWAELRALQGRTRLTPEMVDRYKVAVHRARYAFWREELFLLRLREAGESAKIAPTANFHQLGRQARVVSACVPMNTAPSDATSQVDAPFGEPN